MRDFYLLLNTVVALAIIVLGVATFFSNRRPLINKLFLAFTVSVGIWVVTACVSNDIRNSDEVSLYGNYLVFVFSFFSAYFLLWFSVLVARNRRLIRLLKMLSPVLVAVGLISGTPLVVAGVVRQEHVFAVEFGPLTIPYVLLLIGQLAASMIILGRASRYRGTTRKQRAQVGGILKSLIFAVPILIVTQFIAPALTGSFEITDAGILVMALPVVSLYASVVRHGLFDIKQAVVRSVAYIFVLAALSVIYYVLAYSASILLFGGKVVDDMGVNLTNVAIALILAFIFQPVRQFFDQITNRVFYRNQYTPDEFYDRLNRVVVSTTELRELLRRISGLIGEMLKAERVSFVFETSDGRYSTSGLGAHANMPRSDIEKLYDQIHETTIFEQVEQDYEMRRLFVSHQLSVVVPLQNQEGNERPLGYLLLGDHKGKGYTTRDLRVLGAVRGELTVSIQNAQSLQAVRDLNSHLEQRVNAATKELRHSNAQLQKLDEAKDEFISMASHQLRTPLTSIKGYISMLMEGDVGKVTPEQSHVLEEVFISSERMVRLIGDFLNVSRLQTGKFIIERRPVDLATLVEREIESLIPSASAHGVAFTYKKPKNIPLLDLDENKIQQVVMNFSDNAVYYSRENSKITVALKKVGDTVEFTVKDTGIGVPAAEQSGLFNKFFRATNARKQRPDGTGVGLFLAKKVVTDHGGEIIFSSQEGKGSTFGFRLPIPKNR